MEIVEVKAVKEYLRFIHTLYREDSYYKNNKKGLLPVVCEKNTPFYKNSVQKMVAVRKDKCTLCQAVFIIHKNSKSEMSIAFFEAQPNQHEAVALLIEHAIDFGKSLGVKKLVFGLDGHCNHSVGFSLTNGSFPSFGESYHKKYYHEYFKDFREVRLVSYYDDVNTAEEKIQKDCLHFRRSNNDIHFECADFGKDFTKTMRRYTDLNNRIFQNHRYYYTSDYEEDYYLFYTMKLLLNNENLIFAKKDGEDIGFILWYPDFNELVRKGQGAGIITYIKYKILGKHPKCIKVVEIGLDQGQKNTGLILLLFAKALKQARMHSNINKIISGWILDENKPSKNTTQRYINKPYKDFITYEKDI